MKTEQRFLGLEVAADIPRDTSREEFIATALSEDSTGKVRLAESICAPDNVETALRRVERNGGAPGVDGMKTTQLRGFVRRTWEPLRESLLNGTYRPLPVRRKEIEKPDGGTRPLGIPSVADRFVQQCATQVLHAIWDHTFSESSFGYRLERSQAQAVEQFRRHVEAGYTHAISLDLASFFDRVNHDRLMSRLATRVTDKRVLKLVRAFLDSGVALNDYVEFPGEGTPQGGPLSPILSNVVLDELDKELERRQLRFVRYADDIVILVRSRSGGERVLQSITRYITRTLKLKVNQEKSHVARPWQIKFLGYRVSRIFGKTRSVIHDKAIKRFKANIRRITRRNRGVSLWRVCSDLTGFLVGWKAYYGPGLSIKLKKELNRWIIRRLKAFLWEQWRLPRTKVRMLKKLGMEHDHAVAIGNTRKGAWRISRHYRLNFVLPESYFRKEYGLTLFT